MATGVGEQLVSIPLMAKANPVTVDQVRRQYMAKNARAKNKKAKAAADALHVSSDYDDDDNDGDDNDDVTTTMTTTMTAMTTTITTTMTTMTTTMITTAVSAMTARSLDTTLPGVGGGNRVASDAREAQGTPRTSETHSRKTRLRRHPSG
jgi:hypothetical protein